jgi:hypothetical protein
MRDLLKPGPFLMGLTLVFFGLCAFGLAFALPEASTPEGTVANFELLGQIGGGMIGVGIVAMIVGVLRRKR